MTETSDQTFKKNSINRTELVRYYFTLLLLVRGNVLGTEHKYFISKLGRQGKFFVA